MENCVIQEITYIDELIELCEKASKSNHPNAVNYDVEKMKKRWNRYLIFTKLMIGDEVVSFSGVYDYGNNLVRVVDRLYTEQKYRKVEHELIQGDNRGVYLYYCEAYNDLPEMQMIKDKLYNPERIHRHKWQKGQLLIYNNKATNHKRENGGKKRHLWKIAL